MAEFPGLVLPPPKLRFDYASPSITADTPAQGLSRFGPYDAALRVKHQITIGILFPNGAENLAEKLVQALIGGTDRYPGFRDWFRIPLRVAFRERWDISNGWVNGARQAVQYQVDLVIFLFGRRDQRNYLEAKRVLLNAGIPNQGVWLEKIQDQYQFPWVIQSLAIQIYAKTGGTPWAVAVRSEDLRAELVVGISRAQDAQRRFVVGIVTLFTQAGDYLFLSSTTPYTPSWENVERYRRELADTLLQALQDYERDFGSPESIVLHLCKPAGKWREIRAVEFVVQEYKHVPVALLHLSEHTNFRLFDTSNHLYVPPSGLQVDLEKLRSLLLLDGASFYKGKWHRSSRGVPRVLQVRMDPRSTMPEDEFPRLVRQVFDFSRINWRGLRPGIRPATLNYAYQIARLIALIGMDRWNALVNDVRLKDKAWFL